jgi:hypothetical protein
MKANPVQWDVKGKKGAASIFFLSPWGLKYETSDRFVPPPRPRVKLKEWHLTASTPKATIGQNFVTVIRPFRIGERLRGKYEYKYTEAGFALKWKVASGDAVILLRTGEGELPWGMKTARRVCAKVTGADGKSIDAFESEEGFDEGF